MSLHCTLTAILVSHVVINSNFRYTGEQRPGA